MDLVENAETQASIPQDLLHRYVVDTERLPGLDVGNGLVQWKAVRVKGYQVIAVTLSAEGSNSPDKDSKMPGYPTI